MAVAYSAEVCRDLRRRVETAGLERPARIERYDAGDVLEYDLTGVCPAGRARVTLEIERFVGGGFAGQVYRVRARAIHAGGGGERGEELIPGLRVGGTYALKILVPPSHFALRFRNFIYAAGFQGPFALQVNPAAARAGALWQKFIRRAAALQWGDDRAVCDILATFVDPRIGSCGEISEWVAGRNWRFEVDDHLGASRENGRPGRAEYQAKKRFMARFVELLHELGAPELARQYEWWTCKSQPNCMRRLDADGEEDPATRLTAVDFRAGLALLPCLPMSPGDMALIVRGLARGSLVQFDRGDVDKLAAYVAARAEPFADMREALSELRANERIYRNSQIDVTHNHARLLCDGRLWAQILDSTVQGWRVRGLVDEQRAAYLGRSRIRTLLFAAVGTLTGLVGLAAGAAAVAWVVLLLVDAFSAARSVSGWAYWSLGGALAIALATSRLLRFSRSLWGRADLRRHYGRMLRDGEYFARSARAHAAEQIIGWHRAGRVSAERVRKLAGSLPRFFVHKLLLAWFPAGLHRMLSDRAFARERLRYIFVRPVRLFINAAAREQWMRDMIDDGVRQRILTEEEADYIRGRLGEPYIQKYLKALAVHVCTLPITQLVSVTVAIFVAIHYRQDWRQAWAYAVGILALFQVIPISPGSLTRGLYGAYLVIRERNYRDYRLAFWLGFWKYIGYLAFPLQMAYSYPAIARFMAGRWATGAVHIVPVFGEHGALLEHAVFDLFYNWPLTIRRRMHVRAGQRAGRPTRWWPLPLTALAAFVLIVQLPAILAVTVLNTYGRFNAIPLADSAHLLLLAAVIGGFLVSRTAGGASTAMRALLGALCGGLIGLLQFAASLCWPLLAPDPCRPTFPTLGTLGPTALSLALPTFSAIILGAVAALIAEITLGEPRQD